MLVIGLVIVWVRIGGFGCVFLAINSWVVVSLSLYSGYRSSYFLAAAVPLVWRSLDLNYFGQKCLKLPCGHMTKSHGQTFLRTEKNSKK